jgi:pimeloyl-ACP methyl ester carboxylesterase
MTAAPEHTGSPALAPAENGQHVDVDEGRASLHFVSVGQGEPILFIPGWTCTTAAFTRQLPHFGAVRQALSYDPRGHGRSSKPVEGNNFRRRGGDLAGLIDQLSLSDVTLVGWSYGSYDMWSYLAQFGTDRVKQVVVLDQPPKSPFDPADSRAWGEAELSFGEESLPAFLRAVLDSRQEFWLAYSKYMLGLPDDSTEDHPDVTWIGEESRLAPDSVAVQTIADGLTTDFSEVARSVSASVPTLVLAREDVAERARCWVSDNMPGATFDVIAHHMSFYSDAQSFNELLDRHLVG